MPSGQSSGKAPAPRCEGSEFFLWDEERDHDRPEEVFCPLCGRKCASYIPYPGRNAVLIPPHERDALYLWFRRRAKAFVIAACVLVAAWLAVNFSDSYFSVGMSSRYPFYIRPLTALTSRSGDVFPEDGQWENRVARVETTWWGLCERRCPMRFGRDTDTGGECWLIRFGRVWQPFFTYPEEE